jgi:hypothetical protein
MQCIVSSKSNHRANRDSAAIKPMHAISTHQAADFCTAMLNGQQSTARQLLHSQQLHQLLFSRMHFSHL